MPGKTSQLQIRVRPDQKQKLKQLAREASIDVSSWVLRRLLPEDAERFQELATRLQEPEGRRLGLAELGDFLRALPPGAFGRAVAEPPRVRLDPDTLNYLAGVIDLAARRRHREPPRWIDDVPVPVSPAFGSELASVRLHLLTHSPVALRRRNLFMDASMDDRV